MDLNLNISREETNKLVADLIHAKLAEALSSPQGMIEKAVEKVLTEKSRNTYSTKTYLEEVVGDTIRSVAKEETAKYMEQYRQRISDHIAASLEKAGPQSIGNEVVRAIMKSIEGWSTRVEFKVELPREPEDD